MDTSATMAHTPTHRQPAWLRRTRLLAAVALVWAGLHFLASPLLHPAGSDQPPVLVTGWTALPGALSLVVLLIAGGYLGAWVAGQGGALERLAVSGLALALWATTGGAMDDWLRISHPEAGPPTPAPYLRLILDYLLLAGAFGVLAWWPGPCAPGGLTRSPAPGPPDGASAERSSSTGPTNTNAERAAAASDEPAHAYGGVAAIDVRILLFVTLFMAVALLFLMGPRVAATYRGQVYFALLAGGWLAVHALFWLNLATPAAVLRTAPSLWLAPVLLGLIGIAAASFRPALALPAPYNELDTIPAWALVRPLPVEMVGLGVATLALTLRSVARKAAR